MTPAISVASEDPYSSDAQALLDELSATLASITGSSGRASFDLTDVLAERACFAIARDGAGQALGCGALRPLQPGIAELKRMYSRRSQPGVGAALLKFLEQQAIQLGYQAVWLETRLVNHRAIRFYQAYGYGRISNYGQYQGRAEAACFAKRLTPSQ